MGIGRSREDNEPSRAASELAGSPLCFPISFTIIRMICGGPDRCEEDRGEGRFHRLCFCALSLSFCLRPHD